MFVAVAAAAVVIILVRTFYPLHLSHGKGHLQNLRQGKFKVSFGLRQSQSWGRDNRSQVVGPRLQIQSDGR